MDHDLRMRQRESFSSRSASQKDRTTTGGESDAIRCNRTRENIHRVVDGHCCRDTTAGRIDVELDVFPLVLALQIKQLHDQLVSIPIVDLTLQEHDSVLQQQIAQRHLPAVAG